MFDDGVSLINYAHEVNIALVDLEGFVLHLGKVQKVQHENAHQL
jgi:hypothetical protein